MLLHRRRCWRWRIRFYQPTKFAWPLQSGFTDTLPIISRNSGETIPKFDGGEDIENFEDFASQIHMRHQKLVVKNWYGGLPEMGRVWCWCLWRSTRRSCPKWKEKTTEERGFTNIYSYFIKLFYKVIYVNLYQYIKVQQYFIVSVNFGFVCG